MCAHFYILQSCTHWTSLISTFEVFLSLSCCSCFYFEGHQSTADASRIHSLAQYCRRTLTSLSRKRKISIQIEEKNNKLFCNVTHPVVIERGRIMLLTFTEAERAFAFVEDIWWKFSAFSDASIVAAQHCFNFVSPFSVGESTLIFLDGSNWIVFSTLFAYFVAAAAFHSSLSVCVSSDFLSTFFFRLFSSQFTSRPIHPLCCAVDDWRKMKAPKRKT